MTVRDDILMPGFVADELLPAIYSAADVLAFPSLYEGFGLPILEAMACGTPVVATDAGSLPEVIGTAGGGILVRAHSADALARGISELLAQPAARAELGAQGRKGVVAAYSWPSVARRTADVYAEISAERRGRPAKTTTSAPPGQPRAIASSAPSSH